MKMHEMLLDSMKYPLLNLKPLFLMGLMLLISSLLMGNYADFYRYFMHALIVKYLLVTLLILIFAIITILESGYTFKIIEKSLTGIEKPPELNNFSSMFKHGIKEIIIGVIYFSIPVILLIAILDENFIPSLGMPAVPEDIVNLLIFPLLFLGFISNIIFAVAIPHMAFKGGSFKEAFRFLEIFRKIKQIGLKRLVLGYLFVVIGLMVFGFPILKETIHSVTLIGFTIAELIIAPYILMFSTRFIALIYTSHSD